MHSASGFILNKRTIGESDYLLTFFSNKFGKMDVVGRGTRKAGSKMSPHLQLFDVVEYGFVAGKNYNILTAANSIRNFPSIKKDLAKSIAMAKLLEFVGKFSREEASDYLWENSLKFADWLESSPVSGSGQLDLVLAKITNFFLNYGGFTPKIDGCVLCSKESDDFLGLSFKDGGLVCKNCVPEGGHLKRTTPQTVRTLRAISSGEASISASAAEIKRAREILDEFLYFTSSEQSLSPHLIPMAKNFLFL
jgi:DNA repair protein RecO (recombination protein O)